MDSIIESLDFLSFCLNFVNPRVCLSVDIWIKLFFMAAFSLFLLGNYLMEIDFMAFHAFQLRSLLLFDLLLL